MVLADDSLDRQSLLLRGSLDVCVLALIDREPQHAYGVVEELATYGFHQVSYGTIYPLVTRLRRQGLISQRAEAGNSGPARNVLSTTPEGRAAMFRWSAQWFESARMVSSLLHASTAPAPMEGDTHAI